MPTTPATRCSLPLWLLLAGVLAACSQDSLEPGAERSDSDEAEITDQMLAAIERTMVGNSANGVVPRLNQAKSLGCFAAEFTVPAELPAMLPHGLFAQPGTHPALVRFANASSADDSAKDFRCMSIKVLEVEGQSLWGEPSAQDFLLNSFPALLAANPAEFLAFIEATADSALWKFFLNPFNWDSASILLRGRERIASLFDISYWSATPYRLGPDEHSAVKYSARSCTVAPAALPGDPGENFLRTNMSQQLASADSCFDFMVQFQQDPAAMPVEDASAIWNEEIAPFQPVARLTIANQDFASAPRCSVASGSASIRGRPCRSIGPSAASTVSGAPCMPKPATFVCNKVNSNPDPAHPWRSPP